MSNLSIKSSQFVAVPENASVSLSSTLIPIREKKGAIFGLIKVLGEPNEQRKHLISILEDHLQRFAQSLTDQVNVPRRFEQILQAINEDLANNAREHNRVPLSDVHAVIGIQSDHQIFLSGVGNLTVLFLHRSTKQRFSIYELDRQFAEETPQWEKLFVTVLDGELHPGDIFYIGTRVATRELPLVDLQDILATLPPSGALKRIHQFAHDHQFGGVAFQVLEKQHEGAPKKNKSLFFH